VERRTFIGTLTGGLLAAPLAADAQQAGRVYRVGIVTRAAPSASDNSKVPQSLLLLADEVIQ